MIWKLYTAIEMKNFELHGSIGHHELRKDVAWLKNQTVNLPFGLTDDNNDFNA